MRALSRRERQVVRLLARGMTNKAIADALGIVVGTVKQHLGSAFDKTGCRDRVALAIKVATGKL
jgi:DNA-binding NarL/FixJ family response regulator